MWLSRAVLCARFRVSAVEQHPSELVQGLSEICGVERLLGGVYLTIDLQLIDRPTDDAASMPLACSARARPS